MDQTIDITKPLGASQSGSRDYLFLHPRQTQFDHLPLPGDTVKSIALSEHGHEITFKSGTRTFVRGNCTEIAARTVSDLIDKDGFTPAGHAPESVLEFSEETIRRHRRLRREAQKLAEQHATEIDAVVAWAQEEFRDAVIDEKTYPEIRAQIEERMAAAVGSEVVLAMAYHEGTLPGTWAPDHPGMPPMFTYPEFLKPVFEHRDQVDRTHKPRPKLIGDHLEHSIALQMHELGDEMMYRPLDDQLIWDLHAELCRILQPLAEEDLKPRLLVRVSADRTRPDVIYPADIKGKLDAILNKWGDPRGGPGSVGGATAGAQQAPDHHRVTEEFQAMMAEKVVTFHEISAIIGGDGKGSPWKMPLSRLQGCQVFREKPMHAVVGYFDEGAPETVLWQIVYESAEEVAKIAQAAFEEVEKAFFEAHGVKLPPEGLDMSQPLEVLEKELPND